MRSGKFGGNKGVKKARKKQVVTNILMMAIGGAGGLVLAKFIISRNYSFLQLFYALFWVTIGFLIGTVIHESGHLVMGLLTGYEFVSFRVGSMTWIKEDGKLKRKKFNIVGTGGQCVLMPRECDSAEDFPFFWYNFGGGLFNLITAAIFIPIGKLIPNFYAAMPPLMLGILSLVQAFLNLVPMNLQVPNDGYNILTMYRDKNLRMNFYKQFRINGLLYAGYEPSQIPPELFDFGDEKTGIGDIMKASLAIDAKDFETAKKLMQGVLDKGQVNAVYELECNSELLFCKIMTGDTEGLETFFDKTLKTYIDSSAKTQVSKRRILYAYQLLYKKDRDAAQKEYDAAMKMKDTYPSAGELKSELGLIEYIKERGV
ncbi:MAG: hypothetical protein IK078_06740 [Lachnospiraceae bacterium]|nr:hypothetical protein [Lachnospiraceae bacterium]